MSNRLQDLQKKLSEAILKQQYTRIAKLQQQIKTELSRKENVPLKSLLPKMTPSQIEESLTKMHKVFITADMLYGFALDFESAVRKFDPSMDVHIVRKVKQIGEMCRDITRNVDDFNCKALSDNFGDMCDEAGIVLENIIYKYRQREKKQLMNEQKSIQQS